VEPQQEVRSAQGSPEAAHEKARLGRRLTHVREAFRDEALTDRVRADGIVYFHSHRSGGGEESGSAVGSKYRTLSTFHIHLDDVKPFNFKFCRHPIESDCADGCPSCSCGWVGGQIIA